MKKYSLLAQDDIDRPKFKMIDDEEEALSSESMASIHENEIPDLNEAGSEEEIFSSTPHQNLASEGCKLNEENFLSNSGSEYHLLGNGTAESKCYDVPPLSAVWTQPPMSPVRRAFFIACIMFGILVVSVFLWALPCDGNVCDKKPRSEKDYWISSITGIGHNHTVLVKKEMNKYNLIISYIKAPYLSVGHNLTESQKLNFISGLESDMPSDDFTVDDVHRSDFIPTEDEGSQDCGILMLDGTTGQEQWRVSLRECPVYVNCELLDASGDDLADCLVLGEESMAVMIEPRYGAILWYLHSYNESPTTLSSDMFYVGTPVVIPDINNDGYDDFIFTGLYVHPSYMYPVSNEINQLVLVSGRSGKIIGSPNEVKQCQRIYKISKEDSGLAYSCLSDKNRDQAGRIPFDALLNDMIGGNTNNIIPQYDLDKPKDSKKYDPKINHCLLRTEFSGPCPDCETKVLFTFDNEDVSWHFKYEKSKVVDTKSLEFDGVCHGVVIKVWEWLESSSRQVYAMPIQSQRTTRSSYGIDDEDEVDYELDGPQEGFSAVGENDSLDDNYKKSGKYKYKSTQSVLQPQIGYLHISKREYPQNWFRKFYEHPTAHRHHGMQTLPVNHLKPSEYDLPSGNNHFDKGSLLSSTISETPQEFHIGFVKEKLILIRTNGTTTLEEVLQENAVTQICSSELCQPITEGKGDSVLAITGTTEGSWIIYTTSSSYKFSNTTETSPGIWVMEMFVRKLTIHI